MKIDLKLQQKSLEIEKSTLKIFLFVWRGGGGVGQTTLAGRSAQHVSLTCTRTLIASGMHSHKVQEKLPPSPSHDKSRIRQCLINEFGITMYCKPKSDKIR